MKVRLPVLLRETASRLEAGAAYEWGHVGRCNCGHLVQTLSGRGEWEIYRAFDEGLDEWTEHARHRCDTTSEDVDHMLSELAQVGFSRSDVIHLEYLSDPRVTRRLPSDRPALRRNRPADVVWYMRQLAAVLEAE